MYRHPTLFVAAGLMTAVLHAQTPQTPPPTAAPTVMPPSRQGTPPPPIVPVTTPPSPQAPPGARAPARAEPARPDSMPMQNVRIDLTIADTPGTGTTARKVVTMLIADGQMGRIRSSNSVQVPGPFDPNNIQNRQILINVDASAFVRPDGRVLVSLTLEYIPDVTQGANKPASIHESLTVLVAEGKDTLISQSADPATDRKVTVAVTASVIK